MIRKILAAASLVSLLGSGFAAGRLVGYAAEKARQYIMIYNITVPNPDVRPYLEESWEEMQQEIGKTSCLEIPFNQDISYSLPHYDDPITGLLMELTLYGLYIPSENRIYLNSEVLTTDHLTKRNILAWLSYGQDAQSTLVHEQTHSWLEMLAEEEGVCLGDNIEDGGKNIDVLLGVKYVHEGIASYIQNRFDGKPNKPLDSWVEDSRRLNNPSELILWQADPQEIGLTLVAPIIDTYGEEGIRYLVANPPHGEEINNLAAYQSRAIDALSKYAPVSECNLRK